MVCENLVMAAIYEVCDEQDTGPKRACAALQSEELSTRLPVNPAPRW